MKKNKLKLKINKIGNNIKIECLVLGQLFHSPLLPSSRGSLVPLCFLSMP